MNFKLVLILILASIVVIFTAQNVSVVEIRFLFWNLFLSGALLIFFTFIFGLLTGWILHSWLAYRKKKVAASPIVPEPRSPENRTS